MNFPTTVSPLQGHFLRVARRDQPTKSPKGLCREPNRCDVIRDQMAKVELRACANRRVSYVSKSSKKAVQSLREVSCAKGCPPIGAASKKNSARFNSVHAKFV